MSEKEMNSYRFSSGAEPSDEMLLQLMKEVAVEAHEKNEQATASHLEQMRLDIERKQKMWGEAINSIRNAQ